MFSFSWNSIGGEHSTVWAFRGFWLIWKVWTGAVHVCIGDLTCLCFLKTFHKSKRFNFTCTTPIGLTLFSTLTKPSSIMNGFIAALLYHTVERCSYKLTTKCNMYSLVSAHSTLLLVKTMIFLCPCTVKHYSHVCMIHALNLSSLHNRDSCKTCTSCIVPNTRVSLHNIWCQTNICLWNIIFFILCNAKL